MKTLTFYSYKGGAGRSLALANAARYLARLGFSVVAVDFDLEAPGLHYKFSNSPDGSPLPVQFGVVDYLHSFVVEGEARLPLRDYAVDVAVPGIEKALIQLIAAGRVPSAEYWSKLSGINWHDLFYSRASKGVQIFLELKSRISDELNPDYLLVDSRTGITEMGGVATLLAETLICMVLPTLENLEGARAVLRSLRHFRRENGDPDLDVIIALSRLPQMKGEEEERVVLDNIIAVLNQEAEDLKDTLACRRIFVLHSESTLQIQEALRVGSGVSPDDSILLRDYLRLFASFVPSETIDPKVRDLIERAKDRIWEDPDAAVKEVEELAESFGHPENYRALLRFYEVRNVSGAIVLKRAQRLWELTGDSSDPILWHTISKVFEAEPRWRRANREWFPNLDFLRSVWRDAGNRNPEFGMKLVDSYVYDDRETLAADVLIELIRNSEATPTMVARCISLLDEAERSIEADALVQQFKSKFSESPEFLDSWANHALRTAGRQTIGEVVDSPAMGQLRNSRPATAARVYLRAGQIDLATSLADAVLRDVVERRISEKALSELAEMYKAIGRVEDFERAIHSGPYTTQTASVIMDRLRRRREGRLF